MLDDARVHILDECHVSSAATIKAIYKKINIEHLYGLSGTPYKNDDHELVVKSIIGDQLLNISATRLIEAGVLPRPIIKFVNVPFIPVPNSTYQSIYKEYIVENEIRNNIVLKQAKDLVDKKYKVLVLFRTINHGKLLYSLFKENGIRCSLLSGKDNLKKRNEIKSKIDNDEIDVIVASTIFDIGIDLPAMSALVLAGPTKSYVKTMQRIGRVLRPYPGKKNVAIVDFIDNAKYLSTHSKQRLKIYSGEKAFKIIHPQNHGKTKK
jgi:superfamily II DNA or RNA helicase